MSLGSILNPIISHVKVQDLDLLKKQTTEGDWGQMLRLKWTVVVDVIPGLVAKSVGYFSDIFFHIVMLRFSMIFTDIRLATNAGIQALGFAVTLLPTGVGRSGYGLIESFRKSEFKLLISRNSADIESEVRASSKTESEKYKVYDALQKLRVEINTLGYLTPAALDELDKACEHFYYDSVKTKADAIRYQALHLSPDREIKGTKVQAITFPEKTLLLCKKDEDESLGELELKRLISEKIETFEQKVRAYWAPEFLKGPIYDLVQKLKDELSAQGYVTLNTLNEITQTVTRYFSSEADREEFRAFQQLCVQLLNKKTSAPVDSFNADLTSLFSVVHGDFTGAQFMPANADQLTGYLLSLIERIRSGEQKTLQRSLGDHSEQLNQLEKRLKTLRELEEYRETCGNDYEKFGQKVLEKLVSEKTVTLPSGVVMGPVAQRAYITFNLEERNGKQWISGQVINLGQGAEEGMFGDDFGRLRVRPELALQPAPTEDVQKSFFWRTLLNLGRGQLANGNSIDLKTEDFTQTLLQEWPTKVGAYHKRDKKPQYAMSSEFFSIRDVVQDVLEPECSRVFLLGLYDVVFQDYVREAGITEANYYAVQETSAHLARAARRSFAQTEELSKEIQERLAFLDERVELFAQRRKETCETSHFACQGPSQEVAGGRVGVSDYVPPVSEKFTLAPPIRSLEGQLQYFLSEGKNSRYSDRDQLCILRRGLEILPSINDGIWEGPGGERLLKIVKDLKQAWLEALDRGRNYHRFLHMGSDDAPLLLKANALEFKFYSLKLVDQDIRNYFLARMKTVLQSNHLFLLRPTHPDRARDFRECVDYILNEAKTLKPADNDSLMEIKVSTVVELKRYPHLNYLYNYLQSHPALKQEINDDLRDRRLRRDPPDLTPVTDLDCVTEFFGDLGYSWRAREDHVKAFKQLYKCWGEFFGFFAVRPGAGSRGSEFSTFAYRSSGTHYFYEDYHSVYNSKLGYTEGYHFSDDKKACRTNLFLETYPDIEGEEAEKLLPIFLKGLPFKDIKKEYENEHLLHNEGFQLGEDGMPFYELQSLLGITTYKDLSVDLLVKHFDRYFPRMRKKIFCTFFQAFLTQNFIEEGNTHSLLEHASQKFPEQVFQLLDFLQKRRIKAKQYHWDETTSFLFWMEGVALSYLVRYQKDLREVETAYQNYLMQTRFLLQREEDPELLLELSGRLVSLGPYFENTHKKDSFNELIRNVVGGISDAHDRPREEMRRLDHGFVTYVGDIERTTLENRNRVVSTESFHGVYRRRPNAHFQGFRVRSQSFPFSGGGYGASDGLEFYRQDSRDLIFKEGETLPSYCLENGRIELLEKGNRTGLYLATSFYDSPMGAFFDRIASPKDLYIWKNNKNDVVQVDYKKLGVSFQYERDPNDVRTGYWMSTTHPGYFLDPSYQTHEFEPSSHYLILRNHKGQRVVYMLEAPFTATGIAQTLTSDMQFAVNKSHAQSLVVYHLEESQEIDFSKLGHEEVLYGIYLALQERNYDKVGQWLKEWEKQAPLHNDRTVRIIHYFLANQNEAGFDRSPRSAAIRLKLALSLFNDPLYTLTEEQDEKLKKAMVMDAFCYRNQQNSTFPFKLSDAELSQLNTLVPSNYAFFLMMYMRQIGEKLIHFIDGESLYRFPFDQVDISKDALKKVDEIDHVLRPQEAFTKNFFAYYHLAKNADQTDPRLEELRYLLRACASDSSSTVQVLREILVAVLENPFGFPKAEEVLLLQENFSTEKVITQLYNDARQANFMTFVFEGVSLAYSFAKSYALMQYDNYKSKIPLIAIQMLIALLILQTPSRFFGPLAELCQERYFGIFFRSLLSALLKPVIEWSAVELEKYRKPLIDRIWTRETKESPFLQPTVPAEIHTPTLAFNSQLAAPLDTFLSLQSSDNPYLIPKKCDMSEELATLEEMREAFTSEREASREPCVQRQREKFLKGLDEKKAELRRAEGNVKYEINQDQLGVLRDTIQIEKAKFDETTRAREISIMQLAHKYPAKLLLEVKGGMLKALTLNELIVAFGRQDHARIMESNPSLTSEELSKLEHLIGEYLVAKTASDRLGEAFDKLAKAANMDARIRSVRGTFGFVQGWVNYFKGAHFDPVKDQREINALLADTMQILEMKRCFSGAQNPQLLVFEYFMKMTLRENQVSFLDRLTKSMSDPKALESMLEEAHTGFGKSKVAIPLWLYLTSRAGRIAMITVPEPLLEEMRVHLKKVLGKVFDQGISPIYFDRTHANDLKYLKYINKVFTDAEKHGKCVVISINSLHGIAVLKNKENYFKRVQEDLAPEYIRELDETRRILGEKVSNFIDEATDALYIRYSYDYSVGRKKPLPSSYIEVTREMYDLLVDDKELLQKIDFDFMRTDEPDATQKYIDAETYEKEVLPQLATKIIEKLGIPTEHQAAAHKSLVGNYDASCEEFFKTLNTRSLSNFAQIRRQFVTYLRQSLSCRWNERYKLGKDRIAYPARNGKLIPNSQFSSLDLILNFTYQANIRTPFEMEHVEDFINGLIEESLTKSQQEFEGSVGFKVYQKFSDMIAQGLPQFADLKKEHKLKLLEAINRSPKNRLMFTEGYVLPKLEYFPRKIVSYPHLLFNRVHNQGATGTLVENVPSGFSLNFDLKTIFRNLIVLWQKSKDQVHTIPKLEGRALMEYLFHDFNGNFNVIIDIAGYLRGFSSNEEIAREVLRATAGRNPPIDAVGYIDEEGRNLILKRNGNGPVLRANATINVDRIFQVYTQKDVIGFDINLSREAKAIVTTGRNTRRDFFMQGVGRLRGLNTGMVASFVTIEEEMDSIRQALGLPEKHKMLFEDLFLYVFNLEGEKQGEEAFDVMYHEWLSKIEELFWSKDTKMSMEARTEMFNKLGDFYCQKVFEDPIHSLRLTREELSIKDVSDGALKGLLATFERIVREHPELEGEYGSDKLKQLVSGEFDMGRLREKSTQMRGGSDPQLSFSEVEQEDERDLELEMLQVKELGRSTPLFFDPEQPQPLARPYDDVSQYFRVQRFYPNNDKYVSPKLRCTENFFRIGAQMPDLYRVTLKPARYSLIVQNRKKKTYEIVLLDLHDAQEIYAEMKRDAETGHIRREDFDYYLVGNDTMNLLAQNGNEEWTRDIAEEPEFKKLMLEARPYTGKLLFDLQDQKRIEDQEMAKPFFKSIEDRFVKPWPQYLKALDNYYTLVL